VLTPANVAASMIAFLTGTSGMRESGMLENGVRLMVRMRQGILMP